MATASAGRRQRAARAPDGCRQRGARGALHGKPAAGCERRDDDGHGNADAVRRPRIVARAALQPSSRADTSPIAWSRIARPRSSSSGRGGQRRRDAECAAHAGQLHDVHVQAEFEAARSVTCAPSSPELSFVVRSSTSSSPTSRPRPRMSPTTSWRVADRGQPAAKVRAELGCAVRRAARDARRRARCCRPPPRADRRRAW